MPPPTVRGPARFEPLHFEDDGDAPAFARFDDGKKVRDVQENPGCI
jgi:hypothetical protein